MTTTQIQDTYPQDRKNLSIRLPRDLVAELDALLAARAAGQPGIQANRHGWIASAIRSALDAARQGGG